MNLKEGTDINDEKNQIKRLKENDAKERRVCSAIAFIQCSVHADYKLKFQNSSDN